MAGGYWHIKGFDHATTFSFERKIAAHRFAEHRVVNLLRALFAAAHPLDSEEICELFEKSDHPLGPQKIGIGDNYYWKCGSKPTFTAKLVPGKL